MTRTDTGADTCFGMQKQTGGDMIVTARFMLCLFRLFSLHGFLLAVVNHVLAVGLHAVVVLT